MKTTKSLRTLSAALAVAASSVAVGSSHDSIEVTLLTDNSPNSVAVFNALEAAFEQTHDGIDINVETRAGGTEGDNIVRTRLATGTMTDLFFYNSGSLLQALNPSRTLIDLSDEAFMQRVSPSFQSVVSDGNGGVYGVPGEAGMGGGILYNRKVYEELGLEIPRTWDEFMANNEAISETEVAPVLGSFGATWTSQIFFLADFYNVLQQDPDFAEEFTAGNIEFSDSEAMLTSFRRIQDVYEAGYFNEDFASATYEDALRMLAMGEGAHYPMLTFAVTALLESYPDAVADIGFFSVPGEDADANGLTVWMPGSIYLSQTSEEPEAAKVFLDFVASQAGCEVIVDTIGASGPFLIETCGLPDDVPQPVADMLVYLQDSSRNAPALEFLSPLKGPSLEQILIEIGSGIRDAESGAELYQRDVRRQARQLGLDGWD